VARLQEHGVRQTVLQRRGGLADVEVAVGAGTRGRVRHLDAAVAGRLFDALRRPAALGASLGRDAGRGSAGWRRAPAARARRAASRPRRDARPLVPPGKERRRSAAVPARRSTLSTA
jgi:hypothetical protein